MQPWAYYLALKRQSFSAACYSQPKVLQKTITGLGMASKSFQLHRLLVMPLDVVNMPKALHKFTTIVTRQRFITMAGLQTVSFTLPTQVVQVAPLQLKVYALVSAVVAMLVQPEQTLLTHLLALAISSPTCNPVRNVQTKQVELQTIR